MRSLAILAALAFPAEAQRVPEAFTSPSPTDLDCPITGCPQLRRVTVTHDSGHGTVTVTLVGDGGEIVQAVQPATGSNPVSNGAASVEPAPGIVTWGKVLACHMLSIDCTPAN